MIVITFYFWRKIMNYKTPQELATELNEAWYPNRLITYWVMKYSEKEQIALFKELLKVENTKKRKMFVATFLNVVPKGITLEIPQHNRTRRITAAALQIEIDALS
jgi:hypothetical protein